MVARLTSRLLAKMETERIVSAAAFAHRVGISRPVLAKYQRRRLIVADFISDAGSFFRYDRIKDAKRAIELNRSLNYKHLSAAT
jgi:hypothetical protein